MTHATSGAAGSPVTSICAIESYVAAHPREAWCIRIAPAEQSLAPAPRFMFGPLPDHLTRSMFGSLRMNAVGCYAIRNGRVGYDGIALHEDTALSSPALNHGEEYVREKLTAQARATGWPVPRRVAGQAACIHGPGYNVYGHWLVDFLPRLHVLQASGYDIFNLRYILPDDCPAVALSLLHLIGIPASHLLPYDHAREQVQVDELLVPTHLRTGNRLHSLFAGATKAWIDRIVPEQSLARPDRLLFVSRKNFPSGRVLRNRAAIETLAQDAGFDIVQPEALAVPEQIALFRAARLVLGEYGSGLHGTIYGTPALQCCALRGTPHWLGFIQSSLAHAFGQSIGYVFGDAPTHAITYTFDIYEDDFRRALECLALGDREARKTMLS